MDTLKLRELTEIRIGYQHRDKAEPISPVSLGTHKIVQIRDLDLRGAHRAEALERGELLPSVRVSDLQRATPSGDAERYVVRERDVLFLSRGQRTLAAALPAVGPATIAAYYFYILRPDGNRVLPEYLAWFVNQPLAQAYLNSHLRGSHMKMLPKAFLEDLEIVVPALAVQRRIVELEKLRQREEHLVCSVLEARRKLLSAVSIAAARAASPNQ